MSSNLNLVLDAHFTDLELVLIGLCILLNPSNIEDEPGRETGWVHL